MNILERLAAQADRTPDAWALLAPGRTPLTYRRLHQHVLEVAHTLSAMGLRPNDRLAVVLPTGPEMAATFLATTSCATCAPLNPAYGAKDFEFYLTDLEAKALIIQANIDSPARAVALARDIPIVELEPRQDADAGLFTVTSTLQPRAPASEQSRFDDVALVLHTSGTTARPKIVPLTHRNACASADNTRLALALTKHDRFLHILPMFHTYGLLSTLLASLTAGASVVCTPGFSASRFFAWLAEFRPTWYAAVPTIHQAILARAADPASSLTEHQLRLIFSSAALLPISLRADLERVFRVPVIDCYGMTEAGGQITCDPLTSLARKEHSVGVAAGPDIAIMHEDSSLLSPGETGEVVIRGENVIEGYHQNASANANAFIRGWFRTGDQGFKDADGYLFITGRLKEMINRGGEKVAPQEVDAALMEHPAVAQAVTFAVPDARLGEDIAAAVVLRSDAVATVDDIRRFAARRLTMFKVPRQIIVVEDLPKGSTGKLLRRGLAEKLGLATSDQARPSPTADHAIPRTPTENMLVELWSQLFDVEHVGVHDDFFALGGDSILAAQLLARIRETTQVELSFLNCFETPTLEGLAGSIEMASSGTTTSQIPPLHHVPRSGPLPLSYAQERLWLLEQFGLSPCPYNFHEAIHLRGKFHIGALTKSVQELLRRHEVLRTTLVNIEGEPRQIIGTDTLLNVPIIDLEGLPRPVQEAEVGALARREGQKPFDLQRGPLVRATVLRLAPDEHVLGLTLHDIVCDGWSHGVFWRELAELYKAAVTSRPARLSPLPVQYVDFALWQKEWLQGDVLEQQLTYWKRRLAGAPVLPLHTDYARPSRPTSSGAKSFLDFPPTLTMALKALSQRQGVTLFMTLLAVFQILLHRYTGADDIVVGTLVANRNRSEFEDMLGFCTNTVVLRTDLSGNPRFSEALDRVRNICLGAFAHQDLPFEKLLEGLQPRRELGHLPLFQILFVLHNTPRQSPQLSGLTARSLRVDTGVSRFDLALELSLTGDALHGWIEYRTDLFAASTIARMGEHLHTLLASVSADPTHRLATLSLSKAEERQQLLMTANATATAYPSEQCVHQVFETRAELIPDAVAIVSRDTRVTYAELNRRANQIAHYLQGRGVRLGELVGLCVERSVEMVAGLLGILKAGAAYVPLDPAYPQERLAFVLEDADVSLVLTQQRFASRLPIDKVGVVCLDSQLPAIAQHSDQNPVNVSSADQVAYLLYTSGSTGQPKGVLGLHRATLNVLHWMWQVFPFAAGEVCCHKTSINFGDAIPEILGPLLHGIPTVLIPEEVLKDLPRFVRALVDHRVTRILLVPSLLRVLLETEPHLAHRVPSLTLWFCGGEILPSGLARRFHERLPGCRLINLYGASEVSDVVSWHEADRTSLAHASVPIGRPVSNTRVYLLDQYMQPVPMGVPGELYVGGAGLTRGYLNRPELTTTRFLPDCFSKEKNALLYRTGDLARYLPDGNLEFLGRTDDQIKIRGCRIEPREVELALERHPVIRQAVVVAQQTLPDEPTLVAYLVVVGAPSPSAKALRDFLRPLIPDFMLPSAFVVLEKLPLTPSGKVDRRALPAFNRQRPHLDESFEGPRNALEELLTEIWGTLLGIEQIGIHDSFFELGGHSLLAMRLLSRIRAATDVDVPLLRFFETPTVAGVATFIEPRRTATPAFTPIPPAPRRQRLPASVGQNHLWHLEQIRRRTPSCNIACAVGLKGPLDLSVLERVVATLVERHEALRTTFRVADGRLVQVIAATLQVHLNVCDVQHVHESAREDESRRLVLADARLPFDLACGPLFRVHLWRLDEQTHMLLVSMHHIISDRWSLGILMYELTALYNAYAAGRSSHLPSLPIQYADFAYWQRHWRHDAALQAQLAYWRSQLRGPLRAAAFPARPFRHRGLLTETARQSFMLPRTLSDAVTSLSLSEGATPFMTVMAAFKIFWYASTGEEDLRVATFLPNRQRPEIEGVIGLFTNPVILRTRLSGNPSCREILRRVRATSLEAYDHQDFPFEELVQALERERGIPRRVLSEVMVTWQSGSLFPPALATAPVNFLEMDQSATAPETIATTFDLILELREQPQGIVGSCFYKPVIFEATVIRRLLDDFKLVLERMVTQPEEPIAALRNQWMHGRPS
jgi:amino acid adenylation domain-containing protein